MAVRLRNGRKMTRDRLTEAQGEEGRLRVRSAQPTRQLKRRMGCLRHMEGGQPQGRVAHKTGEP